MYEINVNKVAAFKSTSISSTGKYFIEGSLISLYCILKPNKAQGINAAIANIYITRKVITKFLNLKGVLNNILQQ